MQKFWAEHRKMIVAVLVDAAYAIQAALSDGTITGTEWGGIITLTVSAIGVYFFPNQPKNQWTTSPLSPPTHH